HFSKKISVTQKDLLDPSGLPWANEVRRVSVKDFQDFKVLAFPIGPQHKNLLATPGAQVTLSNPNPTAAKFPLRLSGKRSELTVKLPAPAPAQGLLIHLNRGFRSNVEIHVRNTAADGANAKFRTLKAFAIDRTDSGLSRGYNPDAPVAISFPEVTGNEYRLVFQGTAQNSTLVRVAIQHAPVVERFSEKIFAKMYNSFAPPWRAFLWQQSSVNKTLSIPENKVLDISDKLAADGTLTWEVPAGEWVILRTGMVPTGLTNSPSPKGGDGPEVDKMSYKYTSQHFEAFIGEILRRVPAEDRKTLKVNVMDSYEKGGQNITDDFVKIFKERYGYDPTPYFPTYYGYSVGSPELSDRFLWDMRRLVADRISSQYVKAMADKAHANGMTTWLENYGTWGFPGEFLQYGGQSDEVGGEFWMGGLSGIGIPENRCATSCAHTYGKPKVWAEAFTSGDGHFSKTPTSLKNRGDRAFGEGINSYILHVNIQQDANNSFPGHTAWYNTEFNRKNTWFSQIDLFTTYIRRCGFLLSRGVDVADVAYYIGEDAPKMGGEEHPKCPRGRHHDFINAEVLLQDATVNAAGEITLPHGTTYSVLVLPPQAEIRPEVLRKIEQLVADGATVLGFPFARSPSMENYPAADAEVRALSKKLWGENANAVTRTKGIQESLSNTPDGVTPPVFPTVSPSVRQYGKGKVYINTSLEKIFEDKKLAVDVWFNDKDPLTYSHRRTPDGVEIFFIANTSNKTVEATPEFRVTGLLPELWEPVSGAQKLLPTFMPCKQTTVVPLQLAPNESVFVVFRKKGNKPRADRDLAANYRNAKRISEITTPWTVKFDSDEIRRGPAEPVKFEKLLAWRDHKNDNIRYYSGTAFYTNEFSFAGQEENAGQENAQKKKVFIDLGTVGAMAKVKINGQYAGGAWTPPYRVDITNQVRAGTNKIEVEVVGTWVNRMIGDARLPANQRKVRIVSQSAKSRLDESGLIGPVQLLAE
ncbi:MAG: hypothetical protein LBT53_01750, partial [Puniceicoccales bacterium]|nr:hypothetical protein [Puniceicoccales bacterium]